MSVGLAKLKPVYESVAWPAMEQGLKQVLRTADQAILLLAVQSADNHEQNRHFEAAQQLRIVHRALMQRFAEYWLAPLALQSVACLADAGHISSLRKLMANTATEAVLHADAPDLLDAGHILNSFLYSLAEADLDIHSKMLVLRAFETRLQDDLHTLQQQTDTALAGIGAERLAAMPVVVPAPLVSATTTSMATALADLQAADYDTLEQRLAPQALCEWQPDQPVRDVLQELLASGLIGALPSAAEQSRIHDVQQLFAIIVADSRLAVPARALLACLQLPYSRIALQDQQFFADEQNLAKSLLNEMVRLAAQWQPVAEQLAQDVLYQKLVAIITTFWEAERVEQIPYQQLLFDLLLYGENERQLQQLSAQRLQDSQQGAVQAVRIREQVDQLVEAKLHGLVISHAVEQLLEEGWKHVLYVTGLRYGTESDAWQSAAAVLDDLADTLQMADYYSSRTDFLVRLPSLLKLLREGLLFIELEPSVINQLFAELEADHKKQAMRIADSDVDDTALQKARDIAKEHSLQLGRSAVLPVALAVEEEAELQLQPLTTQRDTLLPEPVAALQQQPEAEPEPLDPQQQQAMKKLATLGQGSMIVWNRDAGQERCRIAAFIRHTKKYILTDRSGNKMAELTQDDMLQKLLDGEMDTLDSGQVFERALESVIGRMRDTR